MTRSRKKPEWALRLSNALHVWCVQQGLKPYQLAREFGASDSIWKHMVNGDNVVSDMELYARVFLRTGLPEADPRTLPFQERVVVSHGEAREVRPWTEEEYTKWLEGQTTLQEGVFSDPYVLASRLHELLQGYMNGTPAQRDALVRRYGPILTTLWADLNTLVLQSAERREFTLRMGKSIKL